MKQLLKHLKNWFRYEPLSDYTLMDVGINLPEPNAVELTKICYNELANTYEGLTITDELLKDVELFEQTKTLEAKNALQRAVVKQAYNLLLNRMRVCQKEGKTFHHELEYTITLEELQPVFERRRTIRRSGPNA